MARSSIFNKRSHVLIKNIILQKSHRWWLPSIFNLSQGCFHQSTGVDMAIKVLTDFCQTFASKSPNWILRKLRKFSAMCSNMEEPEDITTFHRRKIHHDSIYVSYLKCSNSQK
jgi:hypothetical protein